GFPMLVGGIALVLVLGRRCGPAALALGAMAALAAAAPIYGFTWHTTGSPVYPLALDLLGHSLHAGNPEFVALNAGLLSGQDVSEPLSDFLRALMVPWGASFPTEHLGFGLLFPVIVLFGIGGAVRVLKVRGSRFALVALLLLAALPAVALLSPD